MAKTVGTRDDFHERAEIGDTRNPAFVNAADLRFLDDLVDDLDRLLRGGVIRRRDVDRAVVLDVDLHTGALDDRANRLTAGADDLADLVRLHFHREDTRRVRRKIRPRLRDRFFHLLQDM